MALMESVLIVAKDVKRRGGRANVAAILARADEVLGERPIAEAGLYGAAAKVAEADDMDLRVCVETAAKYPVAFFSYMGT